MCTIVKRACTERGTTEKWLRLTDSLWGEILGFLYVDEMAPLYRSHRGARTHFRRVCIHHVVAWHLGNEKDFLTVAAPLLERAKSIRYLTHSLGNVTTSTLKRIERLLLQHVDTIHTVQEQGNRVEPVLTTVLATQSRLRVLRSPYGYRVYPEWKLPPTLESVSLHLPQLLHNLTTDRLPHLLHLTVSTIVTDIRPLIGHIQGLVTLRLEELNPESGIRFICDTLSSTLPTLKEFSITFATVADEPRVSSSSSSSSSLLIRHSSLTTLILRKWPGIYLPHIECPHLRTLEFEWSRPNIKSTATPFGWLCPNLHTLDMQFGYDGQWLGEVVAMGVVRTLPHTLYSLQCGCALPVADVLTCTTRWSHLLLLVVEVKGVGNTIEGYAFLETVLLHCRSLERLVVTTKTMCDVLPSTRSIESEHTHTSLRFLTTCFGDDRFWRRWRFPFLHRLTVNSPATLSLSDLPATCPHLVELCGWVDTHDPPSHVPLYIWRHLTTLQLQSTPSVWKWALYLFYHGTPLERWTSSYNTFLSPPAGWIQPPSRHIRLLAEMSIPLLHSGRATWEDISKTLGSLARNVDLYKERTDSDDDDEDDDDDEE